MRRWILYLFLVIYVNTNFIIMVVICDYTKQNSTKGVYTLQKLTENITHFNEIEDSHSDQSSHYGQKMLSRRNPVHVVETKYYYPKNSALYYDDYYYNKFGHLVVKKIQNKVSHK